jgi:putative transposase
MAKIHSQSIQMVTHTFLANVATCKKLRKTHPEMKMRYPYKEKEFFPLYWPKQALYLEKGKLSLPMGRGRPPLRFRVDWEGPIGGCRLVWFRGAYELHISKETQEEAYIESGIKAAVDLGQIHVAAVTTSTGQALLVSGRGIRSVKRYRNKCVGKIQSLKSKTKKGSKRHQKLRVALGKAYHKCHVRTKDLSHKATTKVIDFCKKEGVDELFVGNPHGVRDKNCGRKQNQRMSQWEYGRDLDYLEHKAKKAGIRFLSGDERGTSSTCPECSHRQKVSGRRWQCRSCHFKEHRDFVGSMNMHKLAWGTKISQLENKTYLRAGAVRQSLGMKNLKVNLLPERSSRPDTGQSSLSLELISGTEKSGCFGSGSQSLSLNLEARPL